MKLKYLVFQVLSQRIRDSCCRDHNANYWAAKLWLHTIQKIIIMAAWRNSHKHHEMETMNEKWADVEKVLIGLRNIYRRSSVGGIWQITFLHIVYLK